MRVSRLVIDSKGENVGVLSARLLIVASIGVGGAGGAVGACEKTSTTTTSVDAGAPSAWTIGVSNATTGGLSFAGTPIHNGWTVAEYVVNSNGGILGKPIKFVELDDETDDNTQADDGRVVTGVATQLVGDGVAAVIGPNGSAQVLTVEDLFFQKQMLEVTASATSDDLTDAQPPMDADGGRFLFRTVPTDSFQGRALAFLANLGAAGADALADSGAPLPNLCMDAGAAPGGAADAGAAGCPTLAVLYYSNAYGTPMESVLEQDYEGSVVARVAVDSTVKADYTAEIEAIVDANPACLAMIVYNDVADAFLLQLAIALNLPNGPFPFTIMGTDGIYDAQFIANGRAVPTATESHSVAEGTYGTDPDSDPVGSKDYSFFASQYALLYPLPAGASEVAPYASNEFDAAMLIALAIAQAGGTSDRVKLRDAFYRVSNGMGASHGASDLLLALSDIQAGRPVSYSGASGPCVMDPYGNVKGGYILWRVLNGELVTLRHVSFCELPQ